MENIIIGGIIGFFAATGKDLILKFFQNKKETKQFYRIKIEEIFYLTDKTFDKIIRMQPQLLDSNHTTSYDFDDTSSKLSMLIQFYAIELENPYKEYITVLTSTATYLTNGVLQNHDNSEFVEKMKFYSTEYQKFKRLIRNEANKYI